ncbi:beta strand repeat-containing protein [Haloferax sp. DFSO60]|uniref:beta strand repeat-containing protein n=1 Tax=Haloferax sp. DFSO60 TaxID=3388652 RepID=UPI003979275D
MSNRRPRALLLSIILLISTVSGGVSVGAAAESTVTVTGTVEDANGQPQSGWFTQLTPNGDYGYIASDGTFEITVDANANYSLKFSQYNHTYAASDYYPKDGVPDVYALDTVSVGDTGEALGTYQLPTTHDVNITVVDESGAPVSNAIVYIQHENGDASASSDGETNADGEFVWNDAVEPGAEVTGDISVHVYPETDTLGNAHPDYNITGDRDIEITLREQREVTGRLVSPDGQPITGADLTALTNGSIEFGETDSNGNFSIYLPTDDSYSIGYLEARSSTSDDAGEVNGVADIAEIADVNSSVTSELGNVTAPVGHEVSIRVIDDSGEPIPDAQVHLDAVDAQNDSRGFSWIEHVDDDGYLYGEVDTTHGFELNGTVNVTPVAPDGDYRDIEGQLVTVDGPTTLTYVVNGNNWTRKVPLSLSANETTVPAGDDVLFRVTNDNDDAVDAVNLTVEAPDGSSTTYQTNATGEVAVSTNGTGDYAITATKGESNNTTYVSDSLAVTAKEPGQLSVGSIDPPAEVVRGENATVDITLSNPGAFEATDTLTVGNGTGTSDSTVTLAAGETLTVTRTVETADTTSDSLTVTVSTSTDSATATATLLEPANISVDDYALDQTTILANEPVNVTAVLNNTGDVEGVYLLSLSVDGDTVANQTVSVGPTSTATTTIETLVAWQTYGTHSVTVATEPTTDITVLQPTNPDASVTITSLADGDVLDSGSHTVSYDLSNTSTGVERVEYRVDDGSYQEITNGLTTTSQAISVGEGKHTVAVRLVDNLGNEIAVSERRFRVDTSAPVISLEANRTTAIGPNEPVTVTVESTDSAPESTTFVVTNGSGDLSQRDVTDEVADGTTTFSWDATVSGSALSSGSYTLEVRSTDAAGNTNTTTQTVSVDADGPTVNVTDVTDGTETKTVFVNDTDSVTISGTVSDSESSVSVVDAVVRSDSTTFQHAVEATLPGDGSWSATLDASVLPDDGNYTVGARATDEANNNGDTLNDSLAVVVDRDAPEVGVSFQNVTGSTGHVNVTTSEPLSSAPDVTVFTPDGNERTVSLTSSEDGWTGTFTYDSDGEYRLVANATDRAGNRGSAEATAQVHTNIITQNNVTIIKNDKTGAFIELHTAADVSDGFGALTETNAPLAVLSAKLSGNQFIEGELGNSLDENLTYAFIGIPVNESELPSGIAPGNVDIRRFNETTNEWELVGDTTVETRNVTGTPIEYYVVNVSHFSTYGAVVVDDTAPSIDSSQLSGSGSPYSYDTETVDVSFEYSDAQSGINASNVTVMLDGQTITSGYVGDLQVTSSSTTLTAVNLVGSGDHTVTLELTDEAGNEQTTTKTFTIEEDTAAPDLSTAFSNTSYAYGTETVSFDLSYTDSQSGVDTSGVEVSLDGSDVTAPATITSSGVEYTANDLTDGSYTLTVTVPDEAGNSKTLTRTFSIDDDDTAPTITSVTHTPTASGTLFPPTTTQVKTNLEYSDAESGVDASAVTVEFDDGSGFVDVTDQAVVTTTQANYTAFDLSPGTYTLRTTVVDADGNERESERTFTIGTGTAPQLSGGSLTPAADGDTLPPGTSQATIELSYTDAEGDVTPNDISATFDGADVTADLSVSDGTITYQATGLADDTSHTFSVEVVDSASNTASKSVTFDIAAGTQSDSSGSSGSSSDETTDSETESTDDETTDATTVVTTDQSDDDSEPTATETTQKPSEGEQATDTVDTESETETTSTGTPGFSLLTAVGALGALIALARRRL